ncbi:hypothetical protein C5167_012641 [Papaver somniferum]|uniref:Uncharacterized protein n=1 Tax=Papaver somniferum TaxID=3469 RepID=A0A4Y7J160_PAPSO|nr:uncharacterized protein LOC113355798 [Papaver somniferum]RZC53790.1 hypothetical protein C5167_012641 [Papaver somniferum]
MLYILTRGKRLVRFDLKSLAVSAEVMKVPCGANGLGLIGHSRGVLYYINYDKESRLSMWQLDYDNASASIWILKHSICTSDMLDLNPGILHTMKLKNHTCRRLFEPFGIHPFSDIIFLGLQGRVYSYHLESHKCEHFWWTTRCMSWRYDFVYPVSYNYVNVKDYRKAALFLNDTARDVKSAHISGDFYDKQVSGHETVDHPGSDYKIDDSRIL